MRRRSFLASILVAVGILKPREKAMLRGVEIEFIPPWPHEDERFVENEREEPRRGGEWVLLPPLRPGSDERMTIWMNSSYMDGRCIEAYERRFGKLIREGEDV